MKTKQCKSTLHITTLLLLFTLPVFVQSQSLVDQYVQDGLRSNLLLKQKSLTVKQAENSLKEARSFYLPSISLLADYTSGDGGRSIALPVGDLLNPVYATLNQMTGSDDFPQIENVEQNFFPKNFYDARVRTSMPLINSDLHFNRVIHGQQVVVKQYEIEAYKRQLVMEIKTAYYNLLSAKSAVKIYESALTLLEKNIAVNQSLLKNGKGLPANVIRATSEYERVRADLNSAKNQETNASRYLNFLLNRELSTPVETDSTFPVLTPSLAEDAASTPREEIKMLNTVNEINHTALRSRQYNRLPKLSAFLDVGSQAYNWEVDGNSKYYLFGVQLSVPLFQGFRTNLSVQQSRIDVQKTEIDILNTTRQLELSTSIAQNEVQTARQNYEAAQQQLKSAQSYFHLIDKGYREGVNALIEFIDARNQLTSSELQLNLRQLEVLIAQAKLERETASYTLIN